MENTAVQTKTNGEFIKILLLTEASDVVNAKILLNDFLSFRAWAQLVATRESIESIANLFSIRISNCLGALRGTGARYNEVLDHSHKFLREIYTKAADMGIEVDLSKIDDIPELVLDKV